MEHVGIPLVERLVAEVRAEMARQGLTATTVSTESEIPRASLSRKLSGQGEFTLPELVRVCRVLGVPVSALAERAEIRVVA